MKEAMMYIKVRRRVRYSWILHDFFSILFVYAGKSCSALKFATMQQTLNESSSSAN